MDTCLRSNAAAGPFSSQPSGLRVFWLAALSLIGRRPQRVFSLFASRIQPKYAAAPLNQSRTWCTSCFRLIFFVLLFAIDNSSVYVDFDIVFKFKRAWLTVSVCCHLS